MGKPQSKMLSAGLVLFRTRDGELEVYLAHPGGPWWKHKDAGAWTIPKGLVDEGEELLDAARREFWEETGITPEGPFIELGWVKQKAGKTVHAWAWRGDAEPIGPGHNPPPRSPTGFPEVDRCEWFTVAVAREKLNPAQVELVERLEGILGQG